MIKMPEHVIDWCNKYDICKGCQFQCTAPAQQEKFNDFISDMIAKISQVQNN